MFQFNNKIIPWLKERWLFVLVGIAALAIALVAVRVNLRFWSLDTVGTDTYYSWIEGRRINDGRNPYERVLHGDMEDNNKYATYFDTVASLSTKSWVGSRGMKVSQSV